MELVVDAFRAALSLAADVVWGVVLIAQAGWHHLTHDEVQ